MRVIIIGSGPAGLAFAHCLLKAGMDDFVILEQRPNPADRLGAALGLWPHAVRILDQLGILDEARKLVPEMKKSLHLGPEGDLISESNLFQMVVANHGHPFMLFERAKLMQLLYHSLPNRKKHVLPGKKVVAVEQDDYGVEVACTDGSKYSGDILVGCDGAHSIARRLGMPGAPTAQPFESKFRCLFGVAKLVDGLEPCSLIETHDKDVMFQLLTSETQAFFLVYEAKGPEEADYKRYTQADCEALARKYGAHAIGRGGRAIFSHLWETRDRADLFDLGEGIADKWHGGRVVLLGDAVHKMTSNHAFGANCALEDAASLTNGLRALLQRSGTHPHSNMMTFLDSIKRSGKNWFYKFACLYLAPAIGDQFVADWCFSLIPKHGVKLDFVPEGQSKVGKVIYSM